MIRRALLPLASVLLMLAGTECVPRDLEIQKKSAPGQQWGKEPIVRQTSCSVNTDRIVACSGEVGIGSIGGTYDNYQDCMWEIEVPQGFIIQFTWNYFDLEGSMPGCPWDYVTASDGTGEDLTGGKLCGSQTPADFTSSSNLVVVTFKSDFIIVEQGFSLSFQAIPDPTLVMTTPAPIQSNCSVNTGQIVSCLGEIRIGPYNNYEDCVWEIDVLPRSVIQFTWSSFDLEGTSPVCPYDYVTVSDYATGDDLTGRLCDNQTPENFTSSSNSAVVTFKSDYSEIRQGFILNFEAIYDPTSTPPPIQSTCSANTGRIVASSGEIGIGSLGGAYNNLEDCVWEIEVPQGYIIQFKWNYFELEGSMPGCSYDYVTVSEYATGDELTGRLCGSQTPADFTSSSNLAVVIFNTDSTIVKEGFSLYFEAIPDPTLTPPTPMQLKCSVNTGRIAACSGEIGIGSYNNYEECVWEIEVLTGSIIQFTWNYFDLEGSMPGCPYDYVTVSDYATGDDLTGRLCDNQTQADFTSSSNLVVVTFKSDSSIVGQGFSLSFEAIPDPTFTMNTTSIQSDCSVNTGRILACSGEIEIGSYNNYEDCVWEIEVLPGSVIQFTWNYFDLEGTGPLCHYDYVIVSDYATGDDLTGRLCDIQTPADFTSSSNLVVVTFKSDYSEVRRGFSLNFESIYDPTLTTPIPIQSTCSVNTGRILESSGEIGIGSLGGAYDNFQDCMWEIEVPQGFIIQFKWNFFELEGSMPECSYDYVTVSDYATGDDLTGRLCDSQTPADFTSISNSVVVTFTSDFIIVAQGFSLSFQAIPDPTLTTPTPMQLKCSVDTGRIVACSGEIGIGSYNNYEECVWEIEVLPDSIIQFTWNYFDLEGSMPGCPYDYVTVTDYATGDDLTGRLCDNQTQADFTSSSNLVVVTFKSDSSIVGQGFSLSFEAIPDPTFTMNITSIQSDCSVNTGRIAACSGEITIGSLGGTYDNFEDCVWEIEVFPDYVIQFTWNYFDLEGTSPGCPYDYVTVSEYATGDDLTGMLCGSQTPANFTSSSNLVEVAFISDYMIVRQGFSLSFEAIPVVAVTTTTTTPTPIQLNCSVNTGRIVASSGEIGIGSIGGAYNNFEDCVWEIEVPQGSIIIFTWNYFDLEGPRRRCDYDYVTISEYDTGKDLTGRLCGQRTPTCFTSSSNLAVVTFKSDYTIVNQGFSLNFYAVSPP